ncbi:MAG: 4'-phosphopantetheinyl transferase superfamily protein [Clostridia bacterium]|nr:4'-phosphopantetheinyl transferase superfamily protein [Clostridia bacterium]
MTVYLLNLHTLCENDVEALFLTLPAFRAQSAKRYRRREAYVQSVAGFCLVRYALQLDPTIDTDAWTFAENGKPYLCSGTPFFNLSHTAHCVAVAVSATEEVGIDIEEIKPRSVGFAKKICSAAELERIETATNPASELIRLWSAKEAESKRSGKGIGHGMREISLESVQSVPFAVDDIPHWLSVSSAKGSPSLAWIDKEKLLSM